MAVDAITKRWIRNASDEHAAAAGCRFNEARGQHVLEFARRYLRLYEGDRWAGLPLEPNVWQTEATMRLFSWEMFNKQLGRWVRRFRKAGIWIPKKNAKSPTLAWWSLYLLCADGEQGQKVYLGAKDGAQARDIAGKHAIEMVLSSPELLAECDIEKTTSQITHVPTRSILKPISSADSKAQKAKEGLNGNVMVDEVHVVDAAFMKRVSRAGISRTEPLQVEVSTAGNDPEGYGKSRYEYGKRVAAGEEKDDRFFFLAYEAPQDLDAKTLAADPEKYGRMANPAWGDIIDPGEFLSDYNESKSSIAGLADFMMYRLNVWQASENPWLSIADWHKCKRLYLEDELLGMSCFGGLDLAKTRDTSALVLLFPWEEELFKVLAYFWLPEARAAELVGQVGYQQWAADGFLKLTPGNMVDYGTIENDIRAIAKKFFFGDKALAYDDYYAHQLVQRLREDGSVGYETPVGFDQTIKLFAGPTARFEIMVTQQKILHNGQPLLTWQVGNTRVKEDVNGNMRPVKQKRGDVRTVDGSVAAIMALALAEQAPRSAGDVEFW